MWHSDLQAAYFALGIYDGASLADEDVGVAYYKRRPMNIYLRNALEFIAESRRSRFLRFLATIGDHLTKKNVAVLAKKTFAASPEPESLGGQSADEEASQIVASESSGSEMEMDACGEYDATSEDSLSQHRSPSSSEASFSSSDGMNADSDFSEEIGGVFCDRNIWRCEECSEELVDWKCPNGHELRCCKTCGWQLTNGPCQKCPSICRACGVERLDGQCSNCGAGEESEYEDTLAWDEKDGLWRCVYCQWEIEADNETDGNCHCLNDKGEALFIDLADRLDYEPADLCSSVDDSTDSESNSDDEGFIDDAEIAVDDIAPEAAIDAVNLAAQSPAGEVVKTLKAAGMAKGAKVTEDKENLEPAVGSDEVEIIDTPTASPLPTLPSNIIDCESMDI